MIRLKPTLMTPRTMTPKPVKPWLLIVPTEAQVPQGRGALYWGQCQPESASPLSQWGHLDAQSPDADWDRLAQLSQQAHTVLLLPAQQVSFFQVDAPKGIKPKEWPLLLEDVTPAAPESLVIAALKRTTEPTGTLSLLVTDRASLNAWQHWAQSQQIQLHHWSSPLQLQPPPEDEETLSVTGHPDYWLIKSPTQWLCWPRALEAQQPPQWHDHTWTLHWDNPNENNPQAPISQWLELMAQQLPSDCPRLAPLRSSGMSPFQRWQHLLKRADRRSLSGSFPLKRSLLVVALLGLSHWGLSSAQQWQTDRAHAAQRALALAARDIPQQHTASTIRQRLATLAAQQQRQQQIEALLSEIRAQLPSTWPPLTQFSVNADHIALTWPQDRALSAKTRATLAQLGTLDISPSTLTLKRSLASPPTFETATDTDHTKRADPTNDTTERASR